EQDGQDASDPLDRVQGAQALRPSVVIVREDRVHDGQRDLMKWQGILRSSEQMRERRASAEAPRVTEAERRVVCETGASELVPSVGQPQAKVVLTDPLDLHVDDRLELAFLQRDPLWRYRRCETRVEADSPTLMGKGGPDRGEF